MNREIKFRAWEYEHEKMIDGDKFYIATFSTGTPSIVLIGDSLLTPLFMGRKDGKVQGDGYELMQFTGLLDKQGVEIFEGDIVRYHDTLYGTMEKAITEKVEWHDDYCGFTPFADYDSDCGVYVALNLTEVIGNIYENPELVGEQKGGLS